jgi:poly(A) polymerase
MHARWQAGILQGMADGGNIRVKPPCFREDAEEVVRRLRDAGHVAYFAGGCVRDTLLGLEPKDYDVATDAPPARVRKLFSNTQAVGAAFGVILVRLRGSQIEVATFRTEGRYLDGRRPESVAFTDAEHDARRRDFTINGLFMDPIEGRIIDYVGGQEDVAARRLRAIGEPDERFDEDHLRLLRAVRFAARFDLAIESRTAEAIRRHAPKLVRISPERIADELRLMLTSVTRGRAWPMLWEFALVDQVFRFLPVAAEEAEFNPGRSVFLALAPDEGIPFGVALAAASLDYVMQAAGGSDLRTAVESNVVQAVGKALRQSLRISNDELEDTVGTVAAIAPLIQLAPPTVAQMKRFLAKPVERGAWEILVAADKVVGTDGRVAWLRERLEELSKGDFAPPPLITGDDLTAAGMRPGPVFRRVLESVYDAQLEDRVHTKDEAMRMAADVAKDAPRTRGG